MILPTDAKTLRLLRLHPIPIGSKSITARQRQRFQQVGWITHGMHKFGTFDTPHFILTDSGKAALAAYESKTLEDTFK